ncbi:MAG TPA: hypothetical protein VID50_04940 [Candidatus Eisenbacteria bacterium]|jgi:hypothetical protein
MFEAQNMLLAGVLGLVWSMAHPVPATAEAVEAAREGARRLRIEAYGDLRYSHFDYGPDQKSGDHGSPPDSRAIIDLPILAAEVEYRMDRGLTLEAEVEFEHGGTGSSLELEYEEFGEFEMEVEKGGEIAVEALHLTRSFGEAANLRAGHFVTAVGLVNWSHEPTDFFTAARAEAEVSVIPVTWDETGVELFGRLRPVRYRLQLVNGLDSSGFSSKYWIVGGHQSRFEDVKATDLALACRLDWDVQEGLTLGGSAYRGNTTGNRPQPDMNGVRGRVTLADVHAELERGPWRGRALYLRGTLENADVISAKNSRLSSRLEVPRTPVAKGAYAWYAEFGRDIVPFFRADAGWKLYPFVHYGRYDTMAEVDSGVFPDPRFQRAIAIAGLNLIPAEGVVVKLEGSRREFGSGRLRGESTISLDVGFATDLFSH